MEFPSETASAPPFRALVEQTAIEPPTPACDDLVPGERLDDFEILSTLGKGGFGIVYLARQLSLDRHVALKVSPDRGHEALTLAGLEHDHIVRVFAEARDDTRRVRLLCMQLVPGATLEQVIGALASVPREEWCGQAVLDAIDSLATLEAPFDPASLRDRELVAHCDFVEGVCWLGARVAEALAHAHSRNVLHRDIKPANILLNRYGRPLLADFNVAFDAQRTQGRRGQLGGTLAYMAPEHLDAFNPFRTAAPVVDERSDVYSLGVVLFELLTGHRPFASAKEAGGSEEFVARLEEMATERRAEIPAWPEGSETPGPLRFLVRRCLAPKPEDRYQSAADLASALEGCRRLHRIQKALPAGGRLTRSCLRYPFVALAILVLLPHVLGSAVSISYNSLRIVTAFTPAQKALFPQLVILYNLLAYSLCLLTLLRKVVPVFHVWQRLDQAAPGESLPVEEARRRVLNWPLWAIGLSCAGWLPGGILFPLLLDLLAGPLPPEIFHYFLLSFTISGLIATTYSLFAMQFIAIRCLYPRLWLDARGARERVAEELRPLDRRLGVFQFAAGLIPLAGAVLMIEMGPEELTHSSYRTFRLLLTALILLGTIGFGLASAASQRLNETLAVLAGRGR